MHFRRDPKYIEEKTISEYNNMNNYGLKILLAGRTLCIHPSSRIARENVEVFCDTWTQCVNDLSRLAKETDAVTSGRLAAEKQAYMSLPRPGVSKSIIGGHQSDYVSSLSATSLLNANHSSNLSFLKCITSSRSQSEDQLHSDSSVPVRNLKGALEPVEQFHGFIEDTSSSSSISAANTNKSFTMGGSFQCILDDLQDKVSKVNVQDPSPPPLPKHRTKYC